MSDVVVTVPMRLWERMGSTRAISLVRNGRALTGASSSAPPRLASPVCIQVKSP